MKRKLPHHKASPSSLNTLCMTVRGLVYCVEIQGELVGGGHASVVLLCLEEGQWVEVFFSRTLFSAQFVWMVTTIITRHCDLFSFSVISFQLLIIYYIILIYYIFFLLLLGTARSLWEATFCFSGMFCKYRVKSWIFNLSLLELCFWRISRCCVQHQTPTALICGSTNPFFPLSALSLNHWNATIAAKLWTQIFPNALTNHIKNSGLQHQRFILQHCICVPFETDLWLIFIYFQAHQTLSLFYFFSIIACFFYLYLTIVNQFSFTTLIWPRDSFKSRQNSLWDKRPRPIIHFNHAKLCQGDLINQMAKLEKGRQMQGMQCRSFSDGIFKSAQRNSSHF